MRISLIVLCSLIGGIVYSQNTQRLTYDFPFAPGEGLVNKTEKDYRQEICLNGSWAFQAMPLPADYKQGRGIAPALPPPVDGAWDNTPIKIPSPWNINAFAYRNLEGPDHRNYPSYPKEWEEVRMAWMKKTVVVPAAWAGKQLKLHFEAVAGYAEVYVNNQKVGENFDLFLPFELDITGRVAAGQTVEMLVGVRDQALFEDHSTIGRRVIPAGSMWGSHIRGIWQDVYLLALPVLHIEDVFVKPLVSQNILELEVTLQNHSTRDEEIRLQGVVREWLNKAGTDVHSAPVPSWNLGSNTLNIAASKLKVKAGASLKTVLQIPVKEGTLDFWTPEHPNLYALLLSVEAKKQIVDTKYERFGWREWSFQGTKQRLNGQPIELKGDSWHFMGVPQLTRRYAWAWFTAIKAMNGNAVRPHAQVYPRFYLDVADEMGICVLDETANWASDGGPKMDSEAFWKASLAHLERFVLRDRNHASVFGWSISNENKPVIENVYNRPDLMPFQVQAWKDWRDIVQKNDPTRPWISADGEDDGDGILPATVGHYGDKKTMNRWIAIEKPWGVGEHSMAYYGTPEQVSKYNGDEAYESQWGRMKGLAIECYDLIAQQRANGASYISVFNMAWYALKPLPIGKKDLTTAPSLTEDGVYFTAYQEGVPGIQPERMGPYSTTFNPGYDPSLPLYDPWPMFDAMRAANAAGQPGASPYANKPDNAAPEAVNIPTKVYKEVIFVGQKDSKLKQGMDAQGVQFVTQIKSPRQLLYLVDGAYLLTDTEKKSILKNSAQGADVWIWGISPQTVDAYNQILPLPLRMEKRAASSFIPEQKSWMAGLRNADFYFCEIQRNNVSEYGLAGPLVTEGSILLNACNTDWRKWNKRPEEIKTAGVYRSEKEATGAAPVFVKYTGSASSFYVSTLTEFTNSEKGYNTLSKILKQAGIPCVKPEITIADVFFLRDASLQFPENIQEKFQPAGDEYLLDFWVWSPRPLDDLLIEPNMPKLSLFVNAKRIALLLNDKALTATQITTNNSTYKELPLLQAWNKITLRIGLKDKERFAAYFKCDNSAGFLSQLKISLNNEQ